jgi:hypothetical protein
MSVTPPCSMASASYSFWQQTPDYKKRATTDERESNVPEGGQRAT